MVAIVETALHWSDILVLLLYFLLILGFGVWVREIKENLFVYRTVFRAHARIVAVLVRKDRFVFLQQRLEICSFRWIFSGWSLNAFYTGKMSSNNSSRFHSIW